MRRLTCSLFVSLLVVIAGYASTTLPPLGGITAAHIQSDGPFPGPIPPMQS